MSSVTSSPLPFHFVEGPLRILTAEDVLINETERKMRGFPEPFEVQEQYVVLALLGADGKVSWKYLLEAVRIGPDEVPEWDP